MSNHFEVAAVLAGMVGKRCESLDNPIGSILRLDIGPLAKRADAKPHERPHGWRHLTILSPWRLESPDTVIADWNIPGGAQGDLERAVQCLIGQHVVQLHAEPPGWDLTIQWSGHLKLFIFSDSGEDREDAWAILGTDGLELGVRPATRTHPGYEIKGV
jgi:hypothetical protein